VYEETYSLETKKNSFICLPYFCYGLNIGGCTGFFFIFNARMFSVQLNQKLLLEVNGVPAATSNCAVGDAERKNSAFEFFWL